LVNIRNQQVHPEKRRRGTYAGGHAGNVTAWISQIGARMKGY
jgi:hypothetical protein